MHDNPWPSLFPVYCSQRDTARRIGALEAPQSLLGVTTWAPSKATRKRPSLLATLHDAGYLYRLLPALNCRIKARFRAAMDHSGRKGVGEIPA
jgi:hypothetical protein